MAIQLLHSTRLTAEAFEQLFFEYQPRLVRFAVRYLDEEAAEDIVQNAFLKLWEKRDEVKLDNIQALLFQMVRNECLNELKPSSGEAYQCGVRRIANLFAEKLASWALGKYSRGAVKMHTLLDLRGSIPVNIHITDGKWHDDNKWQLISIERGAVYTANKAYIDFAQMWKMQLTGAFFVMRPKDNMRYEVVRELRDDTFKSDVRADFIIRLTGVKSRKLYPDELRLVKVLDSESGELITFITNNLDFYPQEIANIYRHRWDIEVFFKWIKQNITIKSLWGYSENAVKTHLWVAITAYLLLAKIKANTQSPYSITEVATLIRVSALEKTELRELLTRPIDSNLSNQNVKELTLFNN